MYSTKHKKKLHPLHYIIKHTKCSRWLSAAQKEKKKRTKKKEQKKKWRFSALPARGTATYPTTWVLYHQGCICYLSHTDKAPPDCPCTFQLHLTCREGFGLQKALLCTTLKHEVNTSHCGLCLPRGWGVKTGKHDNGYTSAGLWALQWPSCLLTLLPLSYKSYPERFIGLTCQAFPVVFGGWGCSTDKRHGDKFCICWDHNVRACWLHHRTIHVASNITTNQ